jgi:hypothetical protein
MYFLVSLLGFFAFASFVSAVDNTSTAALDALVQRQLPFHSDKFVFRLKTEAKVNMKTATELDTFTLSDGSNGTINIECSTRSACARGLYT